MDYKAPIEPKDVDATIGTIFLGTIVPIPTWLGQIGLVIVNDGGDTPRDDIRLETRRALGNARGSLPALQRDKSAPEVR